MRERVDLGGPNLEMHHARVGELFGNHVRGIEVLALCDKKSDGKTTSLQTYPLPGR